jgi:hypothetical protein
MTIPTKLADSSLENYLVGLIPLLRVNSTMALRMLDEEHEPLGQDPADHNVHTLAGWDQRPRHRSRDTFEYRKQSDCAITTNMGHTFSAR